LRLQRQAYHQTRLKNGLKVVTAPRGSAESVAIGIWVKVGGRYESIRLNGVSHFLEHLLFKGTQKRSSRAIKVAIEGAGGTLNAFTDEEFTCLWAKVQPKEMALALEVLTDMALSPALDPKQLERERQVILEEIRMYRDLPSQFVHDLLHELLWPNHPLGRDVTGSVQSVKRIRRSDVSGFQRRYYTPRNIVIAVCGRITHREVLDAASALWGRLAPGRESICRRAGNSQRRPRLKVESKETEQTHLSLGFHAFPRNHPHVQALTLLNVILGGNMSSRLFQEVREVRGLAYEIGSSIKRYRDTGLFSVSAGVEHQHLIRCVQVVLQEVSRLRRSAVAPKEYDRAVEYLTGQILFALEDTVEHMCWMGECEMLLGATQPVESILTQVLKVKRPDLTHVAKQIFRPEHLSLAVIGPVKPKTQSRITHLLNEG